MYFRIVLEKGLIAAKLIYWQDEVFRVTQGPIWAASYPGNLSSPSPNLPLQ